MVIYVDADACPVIRQTEMIAKKYSINTVLISDTTHILNSEYSQIVIVDKGTDSTDMYIVNKCSKNDIVVTQDYGVAAMVLAKGGYPIHQSGRWYTDNNIGSMLMSRYIAKKARASKKKVHLKGQKKRTEEENETFSQSLERLIKHITNV